MNTQNVYRHTDNNKIRVNQRYVIIKASVNSRLLGVKFSGI